jgi:hypothetical protein
MPKAGWWIRGYGSTSETPLKHRQADAGGSGILRDTDHVVTVTNSNDRGTAV